MAMQAFYYANHTNQAFNQDKPGPKSGYNIIGDLELPTGSYIVLAKANTAVNTRDASKGIGASTLGQFVLRLGKASDSVISTMRFEDGANNQIVSLTIAADVAHLAHARFYFFNARPWATVYVFSVALIALRVDTLHNYQVGEDLEGPSQEQNLSLLSELALAVGIRLPVSDLLP
jgi:hypothetical protein